MHFQNLLRHMKQIKPITTYETYIKPITTYEANKTHYNI